MNWLDLEFLGAPPLPFRRWADWLRNCEATGTISGVRVCAPVPAECEHPADLDG